MRVPLGDHSVAQQVKNCILKNIGKPTRASTVIIAGDIGSGKTEIAKHLVESLHELDVPVGGVISSRIMQNDETIGYSISDLSTGETRRFADLARPGIRVGKYFILSEGLLFAQQALARATNKGTVVIVDEIGRLEIAGTGLADAVSHLLSSEAIPILLIRTLFVDRALREFEIDSPEVFTIPKLEQ